MCFCWNKLIFKDLALAHTTTSTRLTKLGLLTHTPTPPHHPQTFKPPKRLFFGMQPCLADYIQCMDPCKLFHFQQAGRSFTTWSGYLAKWTLPSHPGVSPAPNSLSRNSSLYFSHPTASCQPEQALEKLRLNQEEDGPTCNLRFLSPL